MAETNENTALLADENREIDKLRRISWWKRPSPYMVFPVFAFYEIGQAMQKIVQPNALLALACKSHYREDLNFNDQKCQSSDIQEIVSSYTAICSLLTGVVAVYIMPRVSGLSERYGRRFSFSYFLTLNICVILSYIVTLTWWNIFGFHSVAVAFVLLGASGTDLLLWVIMSSYVADCTKPRYRSHIMSYATAIEMAGNVIGPLIVSRSIIESNHLMTAYYVSLTAEAIALGLVVFVLPESRATKKMKKSRRHYVRPTLKESVLETFNVAKPLGTLWRVAKDQAQHNLFGTVLCLSMIEILYTSSTELKGSPEFLYFQMKFGWTAVEIGYLEAFLSLSRVALLSGVIPVALRWIPTFFNEPPQEQNTDSGLVDDMDGITKTELFLIRTGLVSEVLGCMLFSVANNSQENYMAALVESVGIVSRPILQSAFLNIVPSKQLSEFLHSKGALTVIISIAVASAGMVVYSWSVKRFSVLIFVLSAVGFLVAFVLTPWVKTDTYPEPESSDSSSSSSEDA